MLRQDFHDFIFSTSTDGNGKASSCVRALDMLGPILTRHYPYPVINGTMWQRFSLADIQAIHKWICAEMKKGAAKDFKAFRFEDLEDHVAELAFAEINAVHEWICAEDSGKGCCQAVFCVRRTIQNGWSYGVLRRRRSAIYRDSVQVEEREGGEMTKRGNLVVRYDGLHPREDYTSSCYYYWECDVWRLFSIGSLIEMLNKVRGQ